LLTHTYKYTGHWHGVETS